MNKGTNDLNDAAFRRLFAEVCIQGFGHAVSDSLSEADSRLLSARIFERTGLVVGAKSIRNYALYIFDSHPRKPERPSVATLDTLARFVLNAPPTDEVRRKENEGHYPYWFHFRGGHFPVSRKQRRIHEKRLIRIAAVLAGVLLLVYLVRHWTTDADRIFISEDFDSVQSDTLRDHGWIVAHMDTTWWSKRDALPGYLSLYTLMGDNWPDARHAAGIRNLLMHPLNDGDFSVETRLTGFVPRASWQQAGILLSEDSTFSGKVMRLSLSFNDFYGGFKFAPEIYIQAVSSLQEGNLTKPEEIAHVSLFKITSEDTILIHKNLAFTSLKIEKRGIHFRFLYNTGPVEAFAYKEIANGDFDLVPRYVGLFAIQGYSDLENPMPAHFDSFKLLPMK